MRPTPDDSSEALARGAVATAGAALLAASALAGALAWRHMSLMADICGSALTAHCGWCAATVALAAAGLGGLAWALRPAPGRAPA
jgi:hypothetical protein